MLRRPLLTLNHRRFCVAVATVYLKPVSAPAGGLLSFAPPKESNQRKGGPVAASPLRSSILAGGGGKAGFLPACRRAASLPRPFGLIPPKPAVLGAANGIKNSLLRNVSY